MSFKNVILYGVQKIKPFEMLIFKCHRLYLTILCVIIVFFLLQRAIHVFYSDISNLPVLVWWTPDIYPSTSEDLLTCGAHKCLITNSRKNLYLFTPNRPVIIIFYGTDFNENDIPFHNSRRDQLWALLHEESPMNNYIFSHSEFIQMFNYTATFRRESDFPLTTLHLPNSDYLTERKAVSTRIKNRHRERLAPVVYVQSNCDVPSDRDFYVIQLSKYIPIDSYGICLHNKDLHTSINTHEKFNDEEFLNLISKYKFYLAYENALCDDYITEKLFRAFHIGTVPIYKGSSKVLDWVPTTNSVILIDNFSSAKELSDYLLMLDSNDTLYEEYLRFKLPKVGITNQYLVQHLKNRPWDHNGGNFIEAFQCYLCDQLSEIHNNDEITKIANSTHFGCPPPAKSTLGNSEGLSKWTQIYWHSQDIAKQIIIGSNRVSDAPKRYFSNKDHL